MIILYYAPEANHSGVDSHWLYGADLIHDLINESTIGMPHLAWSFVELRGFSRQELRLAYKSADCLLRPARHDGYSFSVQEALHYGLPVLHTYPIPGVILIKPEIEDIEQKLLKLEEKI